MPYEDTEKEDERTRVRDRESRTVKGKWARHSARERENPASTESEITYDTTQRGERKRVQEGERAGASDGLVWGRER